MRFSRHVSEEAINENISCDEILGCLENGIILDRKRKAGVLEMTRGYGSHAIKVVVADALDNWTIITVMRFER